MERLMEEPGLESFGGQRADGNHRSVVVQAQAADGANAVAVVNIHEKELLPVHSVEPSVISVVRQAWVRIDRDGEEVLAAEAVRDVLLRGGGLAVVAGDEGTGRYATAVRALTMMDKPRRSEGRPSLELWQITPDWDPPDSSLLPIGENCGYLLNVSAEIADWSKEMPSKLSGHGRRLAEIGSCLIVIAGRDGWPTMGHEAAAVVQARPPAPRHLVSSHLSLFHRRTELVERLQSGYEPKENQQDLAQLVTDGMHPADAAELARLLAGAADSEQELAAAVERFTGWRDYVTGFFGRTVERPEDRALLLAAVLLEGASPSQVHQAARDLLGEKVDDSVRNALSGLDLGSRLRDAGAKVSDNKVTFTHRPGYGYAVLRHIWTELADAQSHIRKWIARITAKGEIGADRLDTIAELLAKLAAEHNDSTVLPSPATRSAPAALSRGDAAARMLSSAAQHPVLGATVRKQLRENWAQSKDQEVARVAALVCQGTFAARFPGQALVRLRHILARDADDQANGEAGRALRALVSEHGKLALTWAAVNDWIGPPDSSTPGRASRSRAGRRAFLALADLTADPYPTELLLAAARHDESVTDKIVAGWNDTLPDKALAHTCESTLAAWAEASIDGSLPGEQVLDLVERIVSGRIGLDPVAAIVVGREIDAETKAMREFRRRLISRRFPAARPEPS
ncbi:MULTISPECIES: hypothetical protein [Streptomycetaceae]|uniref:hypothetical protein n=1 Tax=Streptomycetaceae TaxID=2062 RepID=UPI00093D359C|nr:hypothetical protein [Streptomyces sp. CB02056]OKI00487.1 hypothetical protein AMK13_32855 [Streptomyces sp. CB02056]